MAKAGGKGGLVGAVLKAGALLGVVGASTGLKQKGTVSALTNSLSTVSHMVGSICSAIVNGKGSTHALSNLLSVAQSFETMLRTHQQARVQRHMSKEKLELKKPEPTNAATAPQPRRVVPNNAPKPAPGPKPTFVE